MFDKRFILTDLRRCVFYEVYITIVFNTLDDAFVLLHKFLTPPYWKSSNWSIAYPLCSISCCLATAALGSSRRVTGKKEIWAKLRGEQIRGSGEGDG